jgi:hypothetical protein
MMHPLQPDITGLSEQDLEKKIQDLTQKYYQAMRYSPSVTGQIVLLLDSYKLEREERQRAKAKLAAETGENEINELIKID